MAQRSPEPTAMDTLNRAVITPPDLENTLANNSGSPTPLTSRDRALLREFLHGQPTPCPGCGYDLRDLQSDQCPECGQALTLRVNLVESRIGQLLGAIIGLCLGAGTAAVMLLVVLGVSVARQRYPTGRQEIWGLTVVPALAVVLQGPILIALASMRGRRWFRSTTPTARTTTIVGSWLLTALIIAVWIAVVFW